MASTNSMKSLANSSPSKARGSIGYVDGENGDGSAVGGGSINEQRIDLERSSMVAERQLKLEGVLDKHDTLVREVFHMEKFVTLLSYDPKVAKEDNSAVFREYQAGYDLLEKASASAGPSRKTRRAQTERLSYLKGPVESTSAPPLRKKGSAKKSTTHDAIWNILSEAKGKGKEKAKDTADSEPSASFDLMPSISRPRSPGKKGKGKAPSGHGQSKHSRITSHDLLHAPDSPSFVTNDNLSLGPSYHTFRHTKRSSVDEYGYAPVDAHASIPAASYSPRKRRKTDPDAGFAATTEDIHQVSSASNAKSRAAPNRVSGRLRSQLKESSSLAPRNDDVPSRTSGGMALSQVPKFSIKRIKLIVRPPPPSYSSPRQRPPPPLHGFSLPSFLSSYTSLDGQDQQLEELEEMARKDAAIYDQIQAFQKQGRLLPLDDMTLGLVAAGAKAPTIEPKRSDDVWDHIVEAAVAKGRARRSNGRQVAGQVANKIQSYWEGHAAKEDKARAQEEKRLRALAKATIKMVTNEWKKVVFHIREEERLRIEAEERRRGHEHLDAILDQSGQILETQQGDLARGESSVPRSRSRSSSVSVTLRDWTSALDEPGETSSSGEEEDEDEEEEEEGDAGIGAEMEVDDEGSISGGAPTAHEAGHEVEDVDVSPSQLLRDSLLHDERITLREEEEEEEEEEDAEEEGAEEGQSDYNEDQDANSSLLLGSALKNSPAPESVSIEPSDSDLLPSETDVVADAELDDRDSILAVEDMVEGFVSSPLGSHPGKSSPIGIPTPSSPRSPLSSSLQLPRESPDVLDPSTIDLRAPNGLHLPPLTTGTETETIACVHNLSHATAQHSTDVINGDISCSHLPGAGDVETYTRDDVVTPTVSETLENGDTSDTVLEASPPPLLSGGADLTSDPVVISKVSLTIEDAPADPVVANDGVETPETPENADNDADSSESNMLPAYLKPYAVALVEWDSEAKVKPPLLLRGVLRPYQHSGLEWLASLHTNNLNGILADEMGLGKTIQTISLLAHLACDRGIWGPHLIIVPTSVLLNWEMEFKKFLPGFKILSYHGTTKRRKELRQGWNDKHHFNVCITSYTLASRDAHIFKRKAWYYMILDEAHMIKNFKSQRWNILLMFRSFRRLLLTGTPLQNNLTELWALLQFLMSGTNFANLKEFGEWFSNPLEKAIEMGDILDDDTLQRVSKLHTVLRPYLLRRLKRDVEKELPSKYEHLILCPLSKRQRFLYDEFMTRAHTRDALQSGVYQKIANILMQLRKVCNHPDLFEVRPIVTSFAMERSAVADFEIKELLVRRRLLEVDNGECLNLDMLGLRFIEQENTSRITALESRRLDGTSRLPFISELPGEPPPKDSRTISGYQKYMAYHNRVRTIERWAHIGYLNRLRCNRLPIYSAETLTVVRSVYRPIVPFSVLDLSTRYLDTSTLLAMAVKSYETRAHEMADLIDKFAFVTPSVVAQDMPRIALAGSNASLRDTLHDLSFDAVLHRASVKLQIAFPDPSLLQYDCGKLQELTRLLREKKAGGHRVLVFTQMTKILDILEVFLSFHGYLYLRLDGATKIEDRQYITERFNADSRVFCFIASSRSGGVGINLTGADTVVFYDSDFNPQMDRQCEDRAHRIGQIRDVHIYRFISQHTVEEAMLRKANQKRSLDDLVIQKGEFDWRSLFGDEAALTRALGEFEDTEDAHAAAVAAREAVIIEGADEADFSGEPDTDRRDFKDPVDKNHGASLDGGEDLDQVLGEDVQVIEGEDGEEEGGTTVDYMLSFARFDSDFFRDWRL